MNTAFPIFRYAMNETIQIQMMHAATDPYTQVDDEKCGNASVTKNDVLIYFKLH